MMRSSNELEVLNEIWEGFNKGKYATFEARELVLDRKWKYHKDKVRMFLFFLEIKSKKIK